MLFPQTSPKCKHCGNSRIIAISHGSIDEMPNERISNGINGSDEVNDEHEKIQNQISFGETLKDFCSNSTVHGVRYLAEPKHHWLERLWWAIAFTLSVILCSISIQSIWTKWTMHPVMVTFDDKTTSIGMIPFPAVSICITQKFKKSKIEEKLDADWLRKTFDAIDEETLNYTNLSPEETNVLDAIIQTCLKLKSYDDDIAPLKLIARTQSIYETIHDITPNQFDILPAVSWLGKSNGFDFKPIWTEEGLCYTFNSLNSHEVYSDDIGSDLLTVRDNPNATNWNVEDGYRTNINGSQMYPYRVFGAGLRGALFVTLQIVLDSSHALCSDLAQGARLSLHMADDLPRLPNEFIHISANQDVYMLVKPNVMTTSDGLRRYAPHERGCFFESERQLRYFKSYSQQKCESECLANFTRAQCGCVQFAMPRDNNTEICTMTKMQCYAAV